VKSSLFSPIETILYFSLKDLLTFFIKASVLDITMKLDISVRLTPQVTTIIYHQLLKKKKGNTIK